MADTRYRLAVSVTDASGRITRWGGDEPNSRNVPQGIQLTTAIPGGFKDCTLSLARKINVDSPDLNLYDTIKIYQPGGSTVWEGRVAQLPRQHDTSYSVQVGAVGWSAHLQDDPSFTEIYVDADPGSWVTPTLNRLIANATANAPTGDYTATSNNGLAFVGNSGKAISITSETDLMYLMPAGCTIAKLMYNATEANTTSVEAASLYTSTTDDLATNVALALTADSTLRTATVVTPARYGMLRARATATHTPAAASPFSRTYKKLAVYGNHGLTLRAAANGTDISGVYASDVIADILNRAAPLLAYTTGNGGSITPTTFPVPHLAFPTPTTASDAISLINGYHLYEWAVWENKTFYFQPPDSTRLTWEARLSDGAKIQLEGDDANNVYNGVLVHYTDPTGANKSVGPSGSNVDATDTTLADTSATNPVNAHGIPKRWAILQISQTTTQAAAIQLGAVWLLEHALPQRRGQLTLTGQVTHPTKGKRPVFEVRAGDWIKIPDHPTDVARRIIDTRYDNDTRTLTASLDNTAFKLEGLMERIGISLIGVV